MVYVRDTVNILPMSLQHSWSHKHLLLLPENIQTLPEDCCDRRDVLSRTLEDGGSWALTSLRAIFHQDEWKLIYKCSNFFASNEELHWDGFASSPRGGPLMESQVLKAITSLLTYLVQAFFSSYSPTGNSWDYFPDNFFHKSINLIAQTMYCIWYVCVCLWEHPSTKTER